VLLFVLLAAALSFIAGFVGAGALAYLLSPVLGRFGVEISWVKEGLVAGIALATIASPRGWSGSFSSSSRRAGGRNDCPLLYYVAADDFYPQLPCSLVGLPIHVDGDEDRPGHLLAQDLADNLGLQG